MGKHKIMYKFFMLIVYKTIKQKQIYISNINYKPNTICIHEINLIYE